MIIQWGIIKKNVSHICTSKKNIKIIFKKRDNKDV